MKRSYMSEETKVTSKILEKTKKVDLAKFKKYVSVKGLWQGALAWLIVFIFSEILISGGQYQSGWYLLIFQVIALLAIGIYWKWYRISWLRFIWILVIYAGLDLLINGWVFSTSIKVFYTTWQTYIPYAVIVILFPITLAAQIKLPVMLKRSK